MKKLISDPSVLNRARIPDVASFEAKTIEPWERIHGLLPGRIESVTAQQVLVNYVPPKQARALVVSPIDDILICLLANGLPQRFDLGIVRLNRPLPFQERLIDWVRRNPQVPILLIHDASLAGCLLPHLLPAQWGLTSDHRIIDLGLRPRDARDRQLPWTYAKAPPALARIFDKLAGQAGKVDLDQDEIKWLRAGSVTSALYLPPVQLLRLVTQAVAQHAPQVVDPEAEAQAQARAVGFMTWPQPVAR
ncbi:hypothetical protein [Chloroflexus sp.]|uniref:hypothetical protein n=1 Tax=Chloroflexus sp. TaxID=1904827 RepID=UPI00260F6DDC|nr:hypothetical protein [uncultured Chloroflexus sp.]